MITDKAITTQFLSRKGSIAELAKRHGLTVERVEDAIRKNMRKVNA